MKAAFFMKNAYTLSCTSQVMRVQVNQIEEFDLSVFTLENQDLFLECCKQNCVQGFIEYERGEWVSLDFFLAHSHFTKPEACSFLTSLIQRILQGLKNQPVILEPQAIFLSNKGDQIRLCRAPLLFETWMKRQEDIEAFLAHLLNIFPSEALEILGLLWKVAYGKESLDRMVSILESIYQSTTKKSLFSRRKPVPPYCAKKPVLILETTPSKPTTQFIKEWETNLPQSASAFFQEESTWPSKENEETKREETERKELEKSDKQQESKTQEEDLAYMALLEKVAMTSSKESLSIKEQDSFQDSLPSLETSSLQREESEKKEEKPNSSNHLSSFPLDLSPSFGPSGKNLTTKSALENATVVLDQWMTPCFLEIEKEKYPLQGEEVFVGRSVGCGICLTDPSISSMHAKLSCQENRWYIQDLKSTNSTWLNEKRVIRKMRLKEGMVICFGQCKAIFHQSPLSHS